MLMLKEPYNQSILNTVVFGDYHYSSFITSVSNGPHKAWIKADFVALFYLPLWKRLAKLHVGLV